MPHCRFTKIYLFTGCECAPSSVLVPVILPRCLVVNEVALGCRQHEWLRYYAADGRSSAVPACRTGCKLAHVSSPIGAYQMLFCIAPAAFGPIQKSQTAGWETGSIGTLSRWRGNWWDPDKVGLLWTGVKSWNKKLGTPGTQWHKAKSSWIVAMFLFFLKQKYAQKYNRVIYTR